MVLFRSIFPPDQVISRIKRRVPPKVIRGELLRIDGYNVLITIETGIKKEFLVRGDDSFLRDIAGRYSGYLEGPVTKQALKYIFDALEVLDPQRVTVLFDRPISHSGKLAVKCMQLLESTSVVGTCDTSQHVDRELLIERGIICSGDSVILDESHATFDLANYVLKKINPQIFSFKV